MATLFMIVSMAVGLWKLGRSVRLADAGTLRGVISRAVDQHPWGTEAAMMIMAAGGGGI